MSLYRDGFIVQRGLRFHYLEWGSPDAPPVVLLHGTTSNAHSWDKLCPTLSQRYRCIAFDWLNHGDSDVSDTAGQWDQQSEDLKLLTDGLNLTQFGLIGLSMGGRTSMAYAGKWPERVNRLVVEDMAPHITPVGREGAHRFQRQSVLEFETWDDLRKWVRRARPFASDQWVDEVAHVSAVPLPDARFTVKYRVTPTNNPINAASSEDLWNLLKNINCPTLLLRGGNSRIIDDEICDRMASTIPECTVETVPQAGHMIHEDNPEVALPLILKFYGL